MLPSLLCNSKNVPDKPLLGVILLSLIKTLLFEEFLLCEEHLLRHESELASSSINNIRV